MNKAHANGMTMPSRRGNIANFKGKNRKGIPNKVPTKLREVVAKYVEGYFDSAKFAADVKELDPKDRVAAYGKLAEYVLPKLQSTTMDVVTESKVTIEDRLRELADKE